MNMFQAMFRAHETGLPDQYQREFWDEVTFININRMRVVSWFSVTLFATLILVVDTFDMLHLPTDARITATVLHTTLAVICGLFIVFYRLKRPLSVREVRPVHRLASTVFSLFVVVCVSALMYFVARNGGNAIAAHIMTLIIWGAAMIVHPATAVLMLLVDACSFGSAMWLAAQHGATFSVDDLLSSVFADAALVMSIKLSFRNYVREFANRKRIEEERNTIAALNAEIAAAYEEAETLNNQLSSTLRDLEAERIKAEELLLNILPAPIADRLKSGETLIADIHEEATILFADIVGFTKLSAQHSAVEVVQMLNWIFSIFDKLSERYHLEKIKTIGDAYMVVGGIPNRRSDHVEAVARMALDMLREVRSFGEQTGTDLAVRVGIHTGNVVAGVIGQKKFVYDLWGDTVNTASRMESHGEAGKIAVSDSVYQCLAAHFAFEPRAAMDVKGKGTMQTYFLIGEHSHA